MARTKQTARQSTGDVAPRMALGSAQAVVPKPDVGANVVADVPVKPPPKRPGTPSVTGDAKRSKTAAGPKPNPSKTSVTKPTARYVRETKARGKVQRIPLPLVCAPDVEAIAVTNFTNAYCYLCQNRGEVIGCDECERVVCLKHMPPIATVPEATRANLHFRCPSCHAIHTQGNELRKVCTPYYGLYTRARNGKLSPYFAHWVPVDAPGSRPQHAQVDTRPIVILSIRLTSLDEDTSPAWHLAKYLGPWFADPSVSHLRYIDIPFDIDSIEMAQAYGDAWGKALAALGQLKNSRILAFLYTHSHDETGDLFFAPKISSSSVDDWWVHVMPPMLADIAKSGNNELTIAMLACGALVNHMDLRRQLMTHVSNIGAKRLFAFAAPQLQAVLLVPFFINFGQRILLDHAELNELNVGSVLEQSVLLARHTPIWIFSRQLTTVPFKVYVYQWTHLTMRPFGEDIGIQCPGCGSLSSRKGQESGDGTIITVRCKKTKCQWSKQFFAPKDVKRLMLGEKGHWTSCPVPV